MQKWIGNDEFLYCHWIAKNERDVYRQLEEANLEGKLLTRWFMKFTNSCPPIEIRMRFMRTFPKMECIGNGVIGILTNPSNAETDL